MAANKQDPRYFKYSPFPKRQCAVTGGTTSGVASFLTTSSNRITLNASTIDPVVVTWANGFDPFPVDYAYKWTSNATNAWGPFAAGTYYLYIDYDPATDTVSYGSTTVVPNDDLIAPSHGAGVHWFDQTKYKMYESVAGVWTERIRVFVGEAISNGSSVTTLITYALNGFVRIAHFTVTTNQVYNKNHYLGSTKATIYGYYNSVTGSMDTGSIPNGSSGYQIGYGFYNASLYYSSRLIYTNRLSLSLRTGDSAIYHDITSYDYFTGATAEIYVVRNY